METFSVLNGDMQRQFAGSNFQLGCVCVCVWLFKSHWSVEGSLIPSPYFGPLRCVWEACSPSLHCNYFPPQRQLQATAGSCVWDHCIRCTLHYLFAHWPQTDGCPASTETAGTLNVTSCGVSSQHCMSCSEIHKLSDWAKDLRMGRKKLPHSLI